MSNSSDSNIARNPYRHKFTASWVKSVSVRSWLGFTERPLSGSEILHIVEIVNGKI